MKKILTFSLLMAMMFTISCSSKQSSNKNNGNYADMTFENYKKNI